MQNRGDHQGNQQPDNTDSGKLGKFPHLFPLYLYSFLYLILIQVFPVISQSGRFNQLLPNDPGKVVLVGGYLAGLILLGILYLTANKRAGILSGIMILIMLAGAMYINRYNRLYNELIHYPPYLISSSNNLASLGLKRWKKELPYDFFYNLGEKYYLKKIIVNPALRNYDHIKKLDRFGFTLIETDEVPSALNPDQIARLENDSLLPYESLRLGGIEYRLYEVDDEDDTIYLTSYGSKIIFIPVEFIDE